QIKTRNQFEAFTQFLLQYQFQSGTVGMVGIDKCIQNGIGFNCCIIQLGILFGSKGIAVTCNIAYIISEIYCSEEITGIIIYTVIEFKRIGIFRPDGGITLSDILWVINIYKRINLPKPWPSDSS